MSAPVVLVVGRRVEQATGVRGEAFGAGRTYFHAVQRAGGVPLLLPPIPELTDQLPALMDRIDAIVLHGGGDVSPHRYGQEPTAERLYGVSHEHDEVELALVAAALAADLPMLAVCRGAQVLNVALGGTLVQHIETHEQHRFTFNRVELEPGSWTAAAMGAEQPLGCHCVHHQVLDRLGDGLRVVGRVDGMVHAVELPQARWVVGTQWHPEDNAATDPQQQGLFDELVRRALA
jgi:putative glutamine amidotransferase